MRRFPAPTCLDQTGAVRASQRRAMGRDGLLPPVFAKIHPKYRTPHINTVITGIGIAALAAVFPLDVLGDLVSMGTLIAFIAVCLGVLILRRTRPELPRTFRVPWAPFTCIAGVLSCMRREARPLPLLRYPVHSLPATLIDGLRAALFRHPRNASMTVGADVFVGVLAVYLMASLGIEMVDTLPPWHLVAGGVLTVLCDSMLTLLAAWMLALFAARRDAVWGIASVLLAATVATALVIHWPLVHAVSALAHADHAVLAVLLELVSRAWWFFVLLVFAHWLSPRALPHEFAQAIAARGRVREDRARIEETPHVIVEFGGVAIAPLRLGRTSLAEDPAQLGGEIVRQRTLDEPRVTRRVLAGQQDAQQHAERVHVGGQGDRAARRLLRRTIAGRHQGNVRAVCRITLVEQARDAEIEHLDAAPRDQHVRRLEVAVHDQRTLRGGYHGA